MTSDQDGWRRWALRFGMAGVAGLLIVLAACENDNDPVAPADSTINVSANPQTVVVPSGGGIGTAEITATVRSKNGTRLPDQEVIFSATAGQLTPPAETPLTTDDNGQATSLLETTTSSTITARSGAIMGTTQVQTAPGDLAPFEIDVQPQELTTCLDILDVTVTVRTTSGDPVSGILVIFTQFGSLTGTFSPAQAGSDADGRATTVWTPSQISCPRECQSATSDPNTNPSGDCDLEIGAEDTTGSFAAIPVTIFDEIP